MEPAACPLEIDVLKTKQLLDNPSAHIQLIDVREAFERELCAIEGSLHIPLRQIPEAASTLPKDRHLLIYCHHGGRSMRVTQFLRAQGFPYVTNVAGGIDAWSQQIDPGMKQY